MFELSYDKLVSNRAEARTTNEVKYSILGIVIAEIQRKFPKGCDDEYCKKIIYSIVGSNEKSLMARYDETLVAEIKELYNYVLPKLSTEEVHALLTKHIGDGDITDERSAYKFFKENYMYRYDAQSIKSYFSKE